MTTIEKARSQMSTTTLEEIPDPDQKLLSEATSFPLWILEYETPEKILEMVQTRFFKPTFFTITKDLLIIGGEYGFSR